MMSAPTAGRPAQGFSPQKAQQWVLVAAVVTGIVYTFRRIIEPSVTTAPKKGTKAAALAGAGSPPPALGQWAIAYGAGFLFLSLMAVAAPELAGSLAMLELAGTLLTNGTSILADITGLEQPATTPATPTKGKTA